MTKPVWRHGKVRDMYQINDNILAMVQSNRQSAFDQHICDIKNKGHVLTETAAWWFKKIMDMGLCETHYLGHRDNVMFVTPCKPIAIEVIVRGYITGNTSTSMWVNYQNGVRDYCGIKLKDSYVKNQKLDEPLITPTTKGEKDELISPQQIIERNYLTSLEWELIEKTALMLYKYGVIEAEKKGLILVDTKYEFGYAPNGHIVLMDEAHTCDSSRYWIKETYERHFKEGKEPEKYDKDIVRYWIKENIDEKTHYECKIPQTIKDTASNSYLNFYERLTKHKISVKKMFDLNDIDSEIWDSPEQKIKEWATSLFPSCIVVSGSEKDNDQCQNIMNKLGNTIVGVHYVCSAHKKTQKLLKLLKRYKIHKTIVFVTVAGLSNALSGVVACNVDVPVIACPPFKDNTDMMLNINSSLMCPSDVPVMTVISPGNAAICVKRILNLE
jgi:phosphoribosylaminoimidazole-succinocarboxamide synthase